MDLVLVLKKLFFMGQSVLIVLIIVRLVTVMIALEILQILCALNASQSTILMDLCASNVTKHVLNAKMKEKMSALLV